MGLGGHRRHHTDRSTTMSIFLILLTMINHIALTDVLQGSYAVLSFVIMQSLFFLRVQASRQKGSSKQRTLILYDSLHSDSSDFLSWILHRILHDRYDGRIHDIPWSGINGHDPHLTLEKNRRLRSPVTWRKWKPACLSYIFSVSCIMFQECQKHGRLRWSLLEEFSWMLSVNMFHMPIVTL